jgi:hypothetical protein
MYLCFGWALKALPCQQAVLFVFPFFSYSFLPLTT